jgi:hypothetical protein
VATVSKAWVYDISLVVIEGSNPVRSIDVWLL